MALGVMVLARGSVDAAIDPVAEARESLAVASSGRAAAESRLNGLLAAQRTMTTDISTRSIDAKDLLADLTDAKALARTHLLDAYIEGGSIERLSTMLGSAGPTGASLRTSLLLSGAQDAAASADAYEVLKRANDPALVALAERADDLQRQVDTATNDVAQASAYEADAERALANATERRAAETVAASIAASQTTTTNPPMTLPPERVAAVTPPRAGVFPVADPGPVGTEDGWARLRQCESHGNYRAVSASGRYRGAYQFAMATWISTGGVGDPIEATPAEQDLRARILYRRSGARSWPHCGVHLS